MKSETRTCQNCGRQFVIDLEDFGFYEKMRVPPPTFCPECRAVRRLLFWNEHNLYRKKEAKDGKEVFSTFPEEAPIQIYDHDYWWSDAWGPMRYGRAYDFSKPFFEQFRELMHAVPWPARSVRGLVNSDYCNQCSYLKNCYLCFNCETAEDCLYAVGFNRVRSSMDFYWSANMDLSYEASFCGKMYEAFFCLDSYECRNIWFSLNCENCTDCFGCANLRHKKYHIFNEPYSKEGYLEKIKEFNVGSHKALEVMKKKVAEFWVKFPRKYINGTHNTGNVVGDYIWNSKNVFQVFQGNNMDNVRYSQNMGYDIKDSYDYTNWGMGSELIYEAASVGDSCRNVKFSFDCWPGCQDVEYSMSCHASQNLFGCFGLKKKSYCILNKQYSKEEYETLREKIIAHMQSKPYISEVPARTIEIVQSGGRSKNKEVRKVEYKYGEFFPPEFSPLAYNESEAQDYFPLTKEGAEAKGFLWRDPHPKEFTITILSGDLPDHIRDVKDEIIKEVIGCSQCKRGYRILAQELTFYRRFGIPLPRLCHKCRHLARLAFRNPLKWQKRVCDCEGQSAKSREGNIYKNTANHFHSNVQCPNEFETSYPPNRPEIVYCEQCYNAEVA